jgi:hypothetical protein
MRGAQHDVARSMISTRNVIKKDSCPDEIIEDFR